MFCANNDRLCVTLCTAGILFFVPIFVSMMARIMVPANSTLSRGWDQHVYVNHFIPRSSFNWSKTPVERVLKKIQRASTTNSSNGEQLFWNAFQRSEPLVSESVSLSIASRTTSPFHTIHPGCHWLSTIERACSECKRQTSDTSGQHAIFARKHSVSANNLACLNFVGSQKVGTDGYGFLSLWPRERIRHISCAARHVTVCLSGCIAKRIASIEDICLRGKLPRFGASDGAFGFQPGQLTGLHAYIFGLGRASHGGGGPD